MTFNKRHQNSLISLLIFTCLIGLMSMIKWDTNLAGFGILILTEFIALIAGGISITLRLFKVKISRTSLVFNYIGILNLILGLTFLIIGLKNNKLLDSDVIFVFNMLIGIYIITDIFKSQKLNIMIEK